MVTGPATRDRRRLLTAAGVVVAGAAIAALAPVPVVLGSARLAALSVMGLGAWLVVGRIAAIDLSVGAAAGLGGIVAGVLAGEQGVPAVAVLPVAAAAGSVVSAAAGALAGHLGRMAGALATLALGAGVLGLLRAVEVVGGRSGYHAVPLLVGGDRTDMAVMAVILAASWVAVDRAASGVAAARAAVAIAAPPLATSFGRSPAADAARLGLVGGAVLGAGGLLAASAGGSVNVDGHGAELTAVLVLAAILAGALVTLARRLSLPTVLGGAAAAVLATVVLHGPGTTWPLAPLVGTAPVLLVMGPVGLALVIAARWVARHHEGEPSAGGADAPFGTALDGIQARSPDHPLPLTATGLAIPSGRLDLEVLPGEVVALVGPNGAGKSTVLARIAGQLPDDDGVHVGGDRAPAGAGARARAGIARGWQRAPSVRATDLATAAGLPAPVADDPADGADDDPSSEAAVAATLLAAIAARGPGLVLLDEPAALLPAGPVGRLLRRLADAGSAVVVVEHRPEVVEVADRVVEVHR